MSLLLLLLLLLVLLLSLLSLLLLLLVLLLLSLSLLLLLLLSLLLLLLLLLLLWWLLLRPWIAIPRLIQVLWTLSGLVIVLLLRGSSSDADVQRGLARRILNTLTGLGPCFIKLGQALSTRPDLVRRDWLEELKP